MYTNDNPRLCPTPGINDNNPVTSVTWTGETSVAIAYDDSKLIWGFKVTIYGQDTEGGEWTPIPNWNAVLLRTYTKGGDDFASGDVTAEGLVLGSGTATWTLGSITADRLLPQPDLTAATSLISNWRAEVQVVNLDGVESTPKHGDVANA